MGNRETVETVSDFIFLGSKITADGDCSHEIKRCLLLGRKVMTNLDSILKSRHYFANKGLSNQGYGFSSGHVWMWELDCEKNWVPKNWCFWTVVLKTLESPLDCKKQSISKGISPECSLEALMLKLELLYFGHLMGRPDWLEKTLMLGGEGDDRGWLVGWHHWFNGHEFEQAPGVGDGQGSLACCYSWGCKESDMTERLNSNNCIHKSKV